MPNILSSDGGSIFSEGVLDFLGKIAWGCQFSCDTGSAGICAGIFVNVPLGLQMVRIHINTHIPTYIITYSLLG